MSAFTAQLLPWRPVRVAPTRAGDILAALFLILVTAQNISTLDASPLRLPEPVTVTRQIFGLYQNWAMFAPHPEITSPWPVIRGELADGTIVDVYNGRVGEPSFARPILVSAAYRNYRWRKYLSNLEDQTYEAGPQPLALNYGRYLCRRWNADAPAEKRLATFRIYFGVEWTPPPGGLKDLRYRFVWHHDCFA